MARRTVTMKIVKTQRFGTLFSIVTLIASPSWACPSGSTCVTYLAFSGESVLAPSGDTTGATDVAAINAAIVQSKPNNTQSVVKLGTGTFYINSTQILDWPYTTIEGHYLSAADGLTGTPGGTILKAAGSWSATYSPTGPAIISTADRDTLRNLTFVGIGGSTPDCVKVIDTEGNDLDKVDVVGCHIGYNTMADNTLSGCGSPSNYYPHQNCNTQLTHLFLGNSINNSSYGAALGGIGGSNPAYASDSFITGTNFYVNGAGGAASPNTCNGAGGMTINFGEYSGNVGPGIWNQCQYWTIVGNQVENSTPPVFEDRTANFNPFVGNQIGNASNSGPLVHLSDNLTGTLQAAGNLFYGSGCVYQVDAALSAMAWYEMPNSSFSCGGSMTTNLGSVIVVPGSTFP
jgi:hypothetical protein